MGGPMQDLNDLYYYVQAVDHGGFAPASRALGMPKSKLSRRIAKLEERLGVRLIQRSTRHFAVTDAGETYYTHCKAMLVEAEGAQEAIDTLTAEPRGVIRMTCPIPLVNAYVGVMLADFMVRYPRVTVQMEATNRRIDLVSESVDVALRVRPPPLQDSNLVMRVLADRGQYLVASAALVQRLGFPAAPSALSNWPSLGLGVLQQIHTWVLYGPGWLTSNTSSHAALRDDGHDRAKRCRCGRCRCSATAGGHGTRPTGGWFIGQAGARLGAAARNHSCGVSIPARSSAICACIN
jgi:DNA-binding transcriptional LysR family regulator